MTGGTHKNCLCLIADHRSLTLLNALAKTFPPWTLGTSLPPAQSLLWPLIAVLRAGTLLFLLPLGTTLHRRR